jgi:hypothetical protein
LCEGRSIRLFLFLLVVATLFVAPNVRAQERRVAVIDVDPSVADAVVVSLSPYGVVVVRVPGPAPDPNVPDAAERAGRAAAEQSASAVVWMTPARDASEHGWLWLYDAATLELTMRPLAVAPPFDAAAAAAVALSVKTALRSSGLVAADPPPPPPPILVSPTVTFVNEPPRALPREFPRAVRLETFVGARGPTGSGDGVEPRASLGASLWPSFLQGWVGIGASAQVGSGVDVNSKPFEGRFTMTSFVASLRLRGEIAHWLALEIQAGPALVLTSMSGSLPTRSMGAERLDGALDFGLVTDIRMTPRVSVGPVVSGLWLMRFQSYAIQTTSVFVQPPFGAVFGLRLSAGLD